MPRRRDPYFESIYDPLIAMLALPSMIINERKSRRAKMTQEERDEEDRQDAIRKAQIAEISARNKLFRAVRSGQCPGNDYTCKGKLIRGKKSRKHNMKRAWVCSVCGEEFYN